MDERVEREIQELMDKPVSSQLLAYITNQAALVIPCLHKPSNEGKYGILPPLAAFIGFLVSRSHVRAGTLLASLVFLKKLHTKLAAIAKGMPCTPHRIFVASLIVTSKAIHDASPKNSWWAGYAAHFGLVEINLMEKQLLALMNYDVLISPEELTLVYLEFKATLRPLSPPPLYLHQSINEVDLSLYAAVCTSSSSLNSSSSNDSSIETVSDMEEETERYYKKTKFPEKTHCRPRRIEQNYHSNY